MSEALNPLERELYAENIKWFADELVAGAEIGQFGQLALSQQRIDQLHQEGYPNLSVEERQIETHDINLTLLKSGIDRALVGAVNIWELMVFNELGGFSGFKDFIRDNDLEIDIKQVETEARSPSRSEVIHLHQARGIVDSSINGLLYTKNRLSELGIYRLGREVKVMCDIEGAKSSYLDGGWTIDSILANGKIKLTKAELSKKVGIDTLHSWQQS